MDWIIVCNLALLNGLVVYLVLRPQGIPGPPGPQGPMGPEGLPGMDGHDGCN